jgi:hypothetical protein
VTDTCLLGLWKHRPSAGLLTCQRHFDDLAAWLIDVESEARKLDARPSMEIRWDQTGGGSLAFERAPVRINVTVATDRRHILDSEVDHPAGFDRSGMLSAYETLHRYAQMVREQRSLAIPTVQWAERTPGWTVLGPYCDPPCRHETCGWWWRDRPAHLDVASERQVLSRHLEWIAGQPWVAQLNADVRLLRTQLQEANGTSDPKPLPGRCPRFDDATNVCDGRLWPVKPTHSTGTFITTEMDSVYAVQCERDHRHRWEGRDLIRLSLILERQGQ